MTDAACDVVCAPWMRYFLPLWANYRPRCAQLLRVTPEEDASRPQGKPGLTPRVSSLPSRPHDSPHLCHPHSGTRCRRRGRVHAFCSSAVASHYTGTLGHVLRPPVRNRRMRGPNGHLKEKTKGKSPYLWGLSVRHASSCGDVISWGPPISPHRPAS